VQVIRFFVPDASALERRSCKSPGDAGAPRYKGSGKGTCRSSLLPLGQSLDRAVASTSTCVPTWAVPIWIETGSRSPPTVFGSWLAGAVGTYAPELLGRAEHVVLDGWRVVHDHFRTSRAV